MFLLYTPAASTGGSGVQDETKYVFDLADPSVHMQAMLYQVNKLNAVFSKGDCWDILCDTYPEQMEIIDCFSYDDKSRIEAKRGLLRLYRNYSQEWQSVLQSWNVQYPI